MIGDAVSIEVRRILNDCLRIAQRAWPHACVLCGAGTKQASACAGCRAELPWLPEAHCPQCAKPTPAARTCGDCLAHPPRFDRVQAAFAYDFPVDRVIQRYKYAGQLALGSLLAESLAERVDPAGIDVIVPMPLAPARLAERGFNQSLELARVVAARHRIPLAPHACRRVKHTPPLASLPWDERAKNIRGAFVCDADFEGKAVAVVDDVLTTGATMNELARNLRRAGARTVVALVVARTVPH